MKPPPVQYADSPEGNIAYQVLGDGPLDLVFMPPGGVNLDVIWEHPPLERYLRRLALFSRLVLVNARGFGFADPVPLGAPPTIEEWVMDDRYVLDAIGSERAGILAVGDIGLFGLLFAATFPERTHALVLLDSYAMLRREHDYPYGFPAEALERMNSATVSAWGTGEVVRWQAPELADDERVREWYGRLERATGSRSMFAVIRQMVNTADLRGVLPSVKAPTLVISHVDDPYVRVGHGRYLAEHVPNARYVERPGFFGFYWLHDVDWVLDEVQEFCTGTRGAPDLDDRVLATVLFTDIVGSTERAAAIGDERWRWLLDEHDRVSRGEIERFRGRLVKSTGDGLLATFDGPARAIRCARALTDAVRPLDIQVRTGLHTGEVELRNEDIGGIAVHIAERVMSSAAAGEVLVSGAVPPLVAGSGIDFDDRGVRTLKGVPGEWQLFAVRS